MDYFFGRFFIKGGAVSIALWRDDLCVVLTAEQNPCLRKDLKSSMTFPPCRKIDFIGDVNKGYSVSVAS
jgi:hypothetical protein